MLRLFVIILFIKKNNAKTAVSLELLSCHTTEIPTYIQVSPFHVVWFSVVTSQSSVYQCSSAVYIETKRSRLRWPNLSPFSTKSFCLWALLLLVLVYQVFLLHQYHYPLSYYSVRSWLYIVHRAFKIPSWDPVNGNQVHNTCRVSKWGSKINRNFNFLYL